MRQRIDAAEDDPAQDDNNGEEPQQARHALAFVLLVPVGGTEYDHVRPGQASYSEDDPDVPPSGQKGVQPRLAV